MVYPCSGAVSHTVQKHKRNGISCAVSQVTAVCIWLCVGSGSAAAAQCSCRHSFILWIQTLTCSHGRRCPEERSGSVRRSSSPSKLYKIPTCIYKAVQNNLNDLRLLCFHFSKAVLYLSYFWRLFRPLHHPTSPPKNLNKLNTTCLSNKLIY